MGDQQPNQQNLEIQEGDKVPGVNQPGKPKMVDMGNGSKQAADMPSTAKGMLKLIILTLVFIGFVVLVSRLV